MEFKPAELKPTDEELMLMYQNGSHEAFQVLYARHQAKVYGFLRSKLKNEEIVQDIFQDVFIKFHHSKSLYKKELPLLPWIFTISRNAVIDYYRKNQSLNSFKSILATAESMIYDEKQHSLTNDKVHSLEGPSQEIQSAIIELSKDQQAALHMRYFDEKTFQEIAEVLRITPTNARQLISRGIKNIKKLLKSGDIYE